MKIEVFVSVVIFVFSIFYLTLPFLRKSQTPSNLSTENSSLENLLARKKEALVNLQDLDLDFETKKVSTPEYEDQRRRIIQEGTQILEILNTAQLQMPQTDVPRSPVQKPKTSQNLQFCPQCGISVLPQAKFCAHCGFKLPGED